VIVRNSTQDPAEVIWQARKIGYDAIADELDDGLAGWIAAGQPTNRIPLVTPATIGDARVLDIRQANEYAAGHLPGADHVELGDLTHRIDDQPGRPTVLMCGHGERAMGGASLMARAGRPDVSVLDGGPQEWADLTGASLEVGP